MYDPTCQLLDCEMPPTAAIALAVTLELPPALAAFEAGEFE